MNVNFLGVKQVTGYPGPFLQDLQGLILYSLIYDVELPKSVPGLKGKIDLNALAAEMIESPFRSAKPVLAIPMSSRAQVG
jgi:hypothetical protein